MEYELERLRLDGFDMVLDTALTREETLEMIVPDACPDILRIVETDGRVLLGRREASNGRVELTGTFQLSVLYVPDGESGVRHLDVAIPFTCDAEGKDVTSGCQIVAGVYLCRADTRAVNPRKVLVRAEAAIDLKVYAPQEQTISVGVVDTGAEQVEQLIETRELYLTACVQGKPFTCSDEVSLPASKPACAEILKSQIKLTGGESKIIGSKLIFKGTAELLLLYRGEDDSLCTVGAELPISQIMEVVGVGEEAECDLDMAVTGVICNMGYDDRTVSVTIDALAQAVIREPRVVNVLSDAYSTKEPLDCGRVGCTTETRLDRGVRSQNVREAWECPDPVREIITCSYYPGKLIQSWEGERLTVVAQGELWVLYLDGEGELRSERHPVEVSCPMELDRGCLCLCRCECVGEVYVSPAPGGLEARFAVEFHYCAIAGGEMAVVNSLCTGEAPDVSGEQPSLVLRMLEGEERLWDVAKRFGTTVADIMGANQLEEETQAAGRLLLIPRKR